MKMVESSSKRAENTVGKGEIARYEQFILFPQCFQKTCTTKTYKSGLVWEWVKNIQIKKGTNSPRQKGTYWISVIYDTMHNIN